MDAVLSLARTDLSDDVESAFSFRNKKVPQAALALMLTANAWQPSWLYAQDVAVQSLTCGISSTLVMVSPRWPRTVHSR